MRRTSRLCGTFTAFFGALLSAAAQAEPEQLNACIGNFSKNYTLTSHQGPELKPTDGYQPMIIKPFKGQGDDGYHVLSVRSKYGGNLAHMNLVPTQASCSSPLGVKGESYKLYIGSDGKMQRRQLCLFDDLQEGKVNQIEFLVENNKMEIRTFHSHRLTGEQVVVNRETFTL
ncbi:hypothetical protein [Dongshaea marina]|uniref:hypothetical protein n=1 Tax=Dongshaea marina TaxID=2047966 RepID=UPI000D3E0B92|nr:hypothetical protein [Dongshaea marina]